MAAAPNVPSLACTIYTGSSARHFPSMCTFSSAGALLPSELLGSSIGVPLVPIFSRNKVCTSSSPQHFLSSNQNARTSRILCVALPSGKPSDINVLVVGATGYIGTSAVKEMVRQGVNVAVASEKSKIGGKFGREDTSNQLQNAQVCFADVTDLSSLNDAIHAACDTINGPFHVAVSCLASRTGAELQKLGDENVSFTYSMVRPTAFFKSLAESMLVYDPETGKYDADSTPSYGKDTLEVFFEKVVKEGMAGQKLGDQAVSKGS
ncbi:hypothetical protein L7F22_016091 [Adiantum nelumboides]|nr:hypothetical protein [Adiantum nelumboides]